MQELSELYWKPLISFLTDKEKLINACSKTGAVVGKLIGYTLHFLILSTLAVVSLLREHMTLAQVQRLRQSVREQLGLIKVPNWKVDKHCLEYFLNKEGEKEEEYLPESFDVISTVEEPAANKDETEEAPLLLNNAGELTWQYCRYVRLLVNKYGVGSQEVLNAYLAAQDALGVDFRECQGFSRIKYKLEAMPRETGVSYFDKDGPIQNTFFEYYWFVHNYYHDTLDTLTRAENSFLRAIEEAKLVGSLDNEEEVLQFLQTYHEDTTGFDLVPEEDVGSLGYVTSIDMCCFADLFVAELGLDESTPSYSLSDVISTGWSLWGYASYPDIKAEYLRLAKVLHPDVADPFNPIHWEILETIYTSAKQGVEAND